MSHIYTCIQAHTDTQMPRGQEAAGGGREVILEVEPDAAELCFGNISGHQILNHSLSPLLFFPPL